MKKACLLNYFFLISSLLIAQNKNETNYGEYLQNALVAIQDYDYENYLINLKYFSTAIEIHNLTPGNMPQEYLDLFTECLYQGVENRVEFGPSFSPSLIPFIDMKIKKEENPKDMLTLGFMYLEGYGIEKSYEKAIYWWEKSANLNNIDAVYNLGYLYSNEKEMLNSEKAFFWYKIAAEKGNAQAMCYVADAYSAGNGVNEDKKEAQYWYRKSCENNYAYACMELDD